MRALSIVCFYGMHVLIARKIGKEEYGLFAGALAASDLLAAVGALGLPVATERFCAQYSESGETGLLTGLLRRSQQLAFLAAAAVGLLAFALSQTVFASQPALRMSLQIASLWTPLFALMRLQRRAFVGLQRVLTSFFGETVAFPLLVSAAVLAVPDASSASRAAPWLAGAALLVALPQAVWLRALVRDQSAPAPRQYQTRMWLRTAFPSCFGGVSQIAMQRSGMYAVLFLLDSGSAGLYGVAQRIAGLIALMLYAARSVAAPMFAAEFHSGRIEQFRQVTLRAALWSTAGALPIALAALLFPDALLAMFGGEFRGGGAVVRALAVGQLLYAAVGPVGTALQMTGHERQYAAAQTFFAAGSLLGCAAAALSSSLLAVAAAASCAKGLLNGWLFLLTRRIWTRRNDPADNI